MRERARITLGIMGGVLLVLLALGALPQYVGGGTVVYVQATPVDEPTEAAVDVTDLPERRFPYLTAALETGRSAPYDTGFLPGKGWFTHTPADEFESLTDREPDAVIEPGRGILVEHGGQRYRVTIVEGNP